MNNFLAWAALAWWVAALGFLAISALATAVFPWPCRGAADETSPPLTIIVPVKDLDPAFDRAQTALFEQAYPAYPQSEIVIASGDAHAPAVSAAQAIQDRYAGVASRQVLSPRSGAASPKLNVLWNAIEQARHDLVLTKDSNVLLAPGDVACFVRHFGPGVGLVSAIPVLTAPQSPAAWVEMAAVDGHYARVLTLARALGMGFGLGKIMLFRRSDLARGGGLESLAWALGEDSAMADMMAGLGLRTVLADRFIDQSAGERSWRQLWNRLLRWKLIWRVQRPGAFIGSLFDSALFAAAAAAVAAPLTGAPPLALAATTLVAWFAIESLMFLTRGWPLSLASPAAFLAREVIELLVWLRALTTSEVEWGGARRRCETAKRACRAALGSGRP